MNNLDGQMTGNVQDINNQQINQQAQVAPVNPPVQTNIAQPIQQSQALFTQEQLNSIISNRINPLNQKISELNSELEHTRKLSESYLSELTGYKNREVATSQGVPSKFVDFAVFEASKLAINGKSFEDAMKEYVSSNKQLFNIPDNNSQASVTTQTPVVQQATQEVVNPAQTVNAQSNNQNQTQDVQFGSTGIQNTQSTPLNADIEAQVTEFLKDNRLIK